MKAPKKNLGQNFLINRGICTRIADACAVDDNACVVEIGPGHGALTVLLVEASQKVTALELDADLIPELNNLAARCGNLEILQCDALDIDLNKVIEEHFPVTSPVVICGNLPYYITSPIIMKVLESRTRAQRAVFMVQKEAAQRLCAAEGSRECGASTLAVRWYSRPKILFDVSPGSFYPAPSVTSSVISLEILKQPPCKVNDERYMFSIIRAAFSQRRKTAANAIASGLGISKSDVCTVLESIGLNAAIRAERITLEDYASLSDRLKV